MKHISREQLIHEYCKYTVDKMDEETQEAVKSLINHLMVAKTKKDLEVK